MGLQSGCLQVFRRSPSGSWETSPAISLSLGSDPVTALVSDDDHINHDSERDDNCDAQAPIQQAMLASVGREVILLDAWTSNVLRSFTVGVEVFPKSLVQRTPYYPCILQVHHVILVYSQDQINGSTISLDCTAAPGHISHLAVAGVGLWVASSATSTVALYHTESFIHMQVRMVSGENEERERTNNAH